MKSFTILFLSIQTALCADLQIEEQIKERAIKSMESQIVQLQEGFFYKAADNQFNTLWTRDFAYSIESLLFHDKDIVVRDHLNFLLDNMDENG